MINEPHYSELTIRNYRSTSVRSHVPICEVDCPLVSRYSATPASCPPTSWVPGWTGDNWPWCVEQPPWCSWSVSSTLLKLLPSWFTPARFNRRRDLCSGFVEMLWMFPRSWARYRSILRDRDKRRCHDQLVLHWHPDWSNLSFSPVLSCSSPGSLESSPSTSMLSPSSVRSSPNSLPISEQSSLLLSSLSHHFSQESCQINWEEDLFWSSLVWSWRQRCQDLEPILCWPQTTMKVTQTTFLSSWFSCLNVPSVLEFSLSLGFFWEKYFHWSSEQQELPSPQLSATCVPLLVSRPSLISAKFLDFTEHSGPMQWSPSLESSSTSLRFLRWRRNLWRRWGWRRRKILHHHIVIMAKGCEEMPPPNNHNFTCYNIPFDTQFTFVICSWLW